ncbi:MAG TPA: hypothetical protein PK778_07370 [Bacillota bacterium]|nr:hypothetical protein [Clostridiales bacterium]HPT85800.1 hypothetical protein [Bacillota bacterium]
MDETLLIHQNDIIYNEPKTKKMYRLESGHIKMITYDYQEVKKFFGLKKELIEVITIDVDTEATELSGPIILREDQEPDFRKYMSKLRYFAEDNKIPMEIKRLDGDNTRINF